ncbi:hypothetical protein ABIC74_003869 [Mucilaginibacter rubeus]|nr:hypothetical protein GCM10011500_21120 [Mucilaginibacter rubeus]
MANKHAIAFLFYLEACVIGVYQNEKDFLNMRKSYQNDRFYHFDNRMADRVYGMYLQIFEHGSIQ